MAVFHFFLEKIGNINILFFVHINNDWREEMKKILIFLSILFLISGCGSNKTLTCKAKNTANGMDTNIDYKAEYKDKNLKYVTITYDYLKNDNNETTGTVTTTTQTTNGTTTTTTTNQSTTTNDKDGINADSDGITNNKSNKNTTSDDVVDGLVGDTIDGAVDGVTNTILDLSGIKDKYENQITTYDGIEGFSYKIDTDNDNEYKVVYKIDIEKISDSDLARFNIDRDIDKFRNNYEDLGYTCK